MAENEVIGADGEPEPIGNAKQAKVAAEIAATMKNPNKVESLENKKEVIVVDQNTQGLSPEQMAVILGKQSTEGKNVNAPNFNVQSGGSVEGPK